MQTAIKTIKELISDAEYALAIAQDERWTKEILDYKAIVEFLNNQLKKREENKDEHKR